MSFSRSGLAASARRKIRRLRDDASGAGDYASGHFLRYQDNLASSLGSLFFSVAITLGHFLVFGHLNNSDPAQHHLSKAHAHAHHNNNVPAFELSVLSESVALRHSDSELRMH